MNQENAERPFQGPSPFAAVNARVVPEERPDPALAQELEPFKCNHCRELVRGAVITICGHLYCWACLWPLLANNASPECPRCRTVLILHEDIVPFYGEGPNARPEDANILAEPGAVPRPTGICINRRHQPDLEDVQEGDEDQFIQAVNRLLNPVPEVIEVRCPRIDTTLFYLKWVQVVCVVLIGLLSGFVSMM